MTMPIGLEINDQMQYTFLRLTSNEDKEILCGVSKLEWVKFKQENSSDYKACFDGNVMTEYQAINITDEIVISRANGYWIIVLEVPLDIEANPTGKTYEYRFQPMGKRNK